MSENEKNKLMRTSKIVILIVSVAVTLILFTVAMRDYDPTVKKTFEVTLSYKNPDAPATKNLTRTTEPNVSSVAVTVSGKERRINSLLQSELVVQADLSVVENVGKTFIEIGEPECRRAGIRITDYYPKEVEVSYDRKTETYLQVKPDYSNSLLAEGYTFLSVAADPKTVPVRGFETEIGNLDYIKASLADFAAEGSIDSNMKISVIGRYITKGGQDVTANFSTEKITLSVSVAKKVPLVYTVVGAPAADYYLQNHTISNPNVLLQGDAEVLKSISSINIGSVNIAGRNSTFTRKINISDYMPSGVTVAGENSTVITVNIEKYVTKTFSFGLDSIAQPGRQDDKYIYEIKPDAKISSVKGNDTQINVTVRGKKATVDSLTVAAIAPTIDMTNKGVGIYPIQKIKMTAPTGITIIGEYTADVAISLKPVETSAATETAIPTSETELPATETAEPTETSTATIEADTESPVSVPTPAETAVS